MYFHFVGLYQQQQPEDLSIELVIYEATDGRVFVHHVAQGRSFPPSEHELSSGVLLRRSLLPDLLATCGCFVVSLLQGTQGEDGQYQGFASVMELDTNFGPVFPAALGTNKWAQSVIAQCVTGNRLTPIDTRALWTRADPSEVSEVIDYFTGRECVLKPNNLGASVLCQAVPSLTTQILREFMDRAAPYDGCILVQERIRGRELSCGTLSTGAEAFALPVIELFVSEPDGILDHSAKFRTGGYTYGFLPSSDPVAVRLSELSVVLTQRIGFETMCRYDYLVGDAGDIYFLEANSKPGLTAESHYTLMLAEVGYSLLDLIRFSISNASNRFRPKGDLRYQIEQVFND